MEWVEKGTRQRSKHGIPAKQAKQAANEGIFDVIHWRVMFRKVHRDGLLNACVRLSGELQPLFGSGYVFFFFAGCVLQFTLQAPERTLHQLALGLVFRTGIRLYRKLVGGVILLGLFQNTDLPLTSTCVAALLIQKQRFIQCAVTLELLAELKQQALMALLDPRVLALELT